MLLIGHEHVMRFAESHLNAMLIIAGVVLIAIAVLSSKRFKAHAVAYCLFP